MNIVDTRVLIDHGDCRELMLDLPNESIDCIVTDPPYKTICGGDSGDRPKGMLSGNRKLFEHQNDIEIKEWFPSLYRVLKQDSHAYVFSNFLNLEEMMREARSVGFKIHNLLVWEKNNKTPSQFYMKNCEYVLFLRKGKAKWINDIGGSDTVHKFPNVSNKTHPCEKPVGLLEFYIRNSTKEGDTVLDPFMGTGSCAIACVNTGRKFIGFERDEGFFNAARDRIERWMKTPWQANLKV